MKEYRHGGDVYGGDIRLDFSVNINPLGLPDGVKNAVVRGLECCARYPDPRCRALNRALAAHHGVPGEWLICANGAADLIYQLAFARGFQKALVLAPTFSEYEEALRSAGCQVEYEDLSETDGWVPDMERLVRRLAPDLGAVFLCNPNNPTGIPVPKEEMERLAARCQSLGILAVADECFVDLTEQPDRYSLLDEAGRFSSLLIIRAFTKTYAMAGIRLGYGVTSDVSLIEALERARQPWSVSVLAQAAGVAALEETAYLEAARTLIRRERRFLKEGLKDLGFQVWDSAVNYLLFRDLGPRGGRQLQERCRDRGILIRSCRDYRGLDSSYYRICVKTRSENEQLLAALSEIRREEGGEV